MVETDGSISLLLAKSPRETNGVEKERFCKDSWSLVD